jgi:hypothetical protein
LLKILSENDMRIINCAVGKKDNKQREMSKCPFSSPALTGFHGGVHIPHELQDSTLLTHHEILNPDRFATDEHNNFINLSHHHLHIK